MTTDELTEAILALQDRVRLLRVYGSRAPTTAQRALDRLVEQRRHRAARRRRAVSEA